MDNRTLCNAHNLPSVGATCPSNITVSRRAQRSNRCWLFPTVPSADNESLVSSSREILSEQSNLGQSTRLGESLERFYEERILINRGPLQRALQVSSQAIQQMLPKLTKHFKTASLKLAWHDLSTPVQQNRECTQLCLTLACSLPSIPELRHVKPGYVYIPLKRLAEDEGGRDHFKFGRLETENGFACLSPAIVACFLNGILLSAVEKSTITIGKCSHNLQHSEEAEPSSNVLCIGTESQDTHSPAHVLVHVKLALCHPDDKDMFFIGLSDSKSTQACSTDKQPLYSTVGHKSTPTRLNANMINENTWKITFMRREKRIMSRIENADRGMRLRAKECLDLLLYADQTLQGLKPHHTTCALLHSFDGAVDATPRWQRTQSAQCLIHIIHQLSTFLADGYMPDFFLPESNLLEDMTSRTLTNLRARLSYMLNHHGDICRMLNRHRYIQTI